MNIVEIVFSPTGGTKKVADMICNSWGSGVTTIDLGDASADFSIYKIEKEDRVLIAMPSFGGRAPLVAVERLKQISGNGAQCTIACVYGNRAYEDTLVEMEDVAKECGFVVTSAIAAVAEHSILPQYATGRPNKADQEQLENFAKQILEKKEEVDQLPGNRPYKKSGGAGVVPKPTKNCVKCGICAKECPVLAISSSDFKADPKKCIGCMRCIKKCPEDARKANGLMLAVASLALKKACQEAKENELFF